MLPQWNFQNQVNAVGGMIFLIVGSYFAWDLTRSTEIPPCSARFGVPTQMSFQKANGTVLSPPEFQARVGINERGVIEKTQIHRVIGDKPLVLNIQLGGPLSEDTGVRFGWTLAGLDKAAGACLAYNVFVPSTFNFGNGGTLPGLFGQASGVVADDAVSGVEAALSWNDQGNLVQSVQFSGSTAALQNAQPTHLMTMANLPRGRWARIEQEAVFNTPDVADGTVRLWVDGRLALEHTQLMLRLHPGIRWAGTLADVRYLTSHSGVDRPPTLVQLTPPQMSWK